MDEVETTYTTIRISTARRRELERLRLKLTVERDEVVMIQDALDIAIAAGVAALNAMEANDGA